jgi:hypothetical protein
MSHISLHKVFTHRQEKSMTFNITAIQDEIAQLDEKLDGIRIEATAR